MNFHSRFSEPLFSHADAQTSNTSTRLWFYYIITKIHPQFQNPGSAPVFRELKSSGRKLIIMWILPGQALLRNDASSGTIEAERNLSTVF